MPHVPPHTELRFRLPDGTPVLLRPIRPEDREALREGFERLSPASRRTRFFGAVDHLTEDQLRYLTEVDQEQHVAWGATTDTDPPEGLAVARFARLPEDPTTAEVAVTVVDAWQNRGLGSLLLAVLYLLALRLGVQRFRAFVLLENEALVQGLRALGGRLGPSVEGATEVELPVVPPEALPDAPLARPFAALLAEVDAALEAARAAPPSAEA